MRSGFLQGLFLTLDSSNAVFSTVAPVEKLSISALSDLKTLQKREREQKSSAHDIKETEHTNHGKS